VRDQGKRWMMLQRWQLRTPSLRIGWPSKTQRDGLAAKTRRELSVLGRTTREAAQLAGEKIGLLAQWTWGGMAHIGETIQDVDWPTVEEFHAMREDTWHALGRSLVSSYAFVALKLDVSWHSPLPEGARIIAANHPTTVDPALVMTLTPERSSILIHETLFKVPVLGRYLKHAGHVPVITGSGRSAFEKAEQLLEEGRTIVIFPEGALSPAEGGFHRPHTGAARLALSTGAPIIPVGIHLEQERIETIETEVDGRTEAGRLYLKGPYAMTVGEPMTLSGDIDDREYVRSASERIMQRIMGLSQKSAIRIQAARLSRTAPMTASLALASLS
jgi:1-acyl-sn-glycerol-3-phosphate acyltransferase